MSEDISYEGVVLRLMILLYRIREPFTKCVEPICNEHGLTGEQYGLLGALKYFGRPVRVTDLAKSIERELNSVSMIVERMVNAGLLTRTRDKRDHRIVYVDMTDTGKNAFQLVTPRYFEFVQKALSALSYEDMCKLISMLELIKNAVLECLDPEVDIKEIRRTSNIYRTDLFERTIHPTLLSTSDVKCQDGGKIKPI